TIWGGKGVYGTFFSDEPGHLYGINWLPFHGGSLYLGRWPEFAERAYAALLRARGGRQWEAWGTLVRMFRALSDPTGPARQWRALAPSVSAEAGNSRANVAHWLSTLALAGRVERTVSATTPLYAAFRDGPERTYVVYNARRKAMTVQFSDGARLTVEPGAFG